jgi:hypothetical protein
MPGCPFIPYNNANSPRRGSIYEGSEERGINEQIGEGFERAKCHQVKSERILFGTWCLTKLLGNLAENIMRAVKYSQPSLKMKVICCNEPCRDDIFPCNGSFSQKCKVLDLSQMLKTLFIWK